MKDAFYLCVRGGGGQGKKKARMKRASEGKNIKNVGGGYPAAACRVLSMKKLFSSDGDQLECTFLKYVINIQRKCDRNLYKG